ncbi:fungal-specific transcription factor domain-containing protein [Trichoderma asperelloides]|nr:fungal-specific transcription factor domain-containing protein [Trichoderma asperelloides]
MDKVIRLSTSSDVDARRAPRKRSAAACRACHDRKVRCNAVSSGSPCVNCSLDGISSPSVELLHGKMDNSTGGLDASAAFGHPFAPAISAGEGCSQTPSPVREPSTGPFVDDRSVPYRPLNHHFSHHGDGQTVPGSRAEAQAPVYGDPRGVTFVADICEPKLKNNSGHFLVPKAIAACLGPEDLDYLRLKGVFSLPGPPVCDLIIRAYFHHVHPFFPIVDAKSFLDMYESPERVNLSVHLLWSMFLAASNVRSDAPSNPPPMAQLTCSRLANNIGKVLYDLEYERNRITLIQAVLLMGFWYADTEDRTGPWHWIGVAISLCQTIGLHRKPDSITRSVSASVERLWRQIWWACVFRDAWFSVGMGRPMHINLDDCNTPMPDTNDSDELLRGIPSNVREKYIPNGAEDLSRMWVELLRLTIVLAGVLSVHYRAERAKLEMSEVEEIERKITACFQSRDGLKNSHIRAVSLHVYHLELYLESVKLVLYRPYLLEPSQEDPSAASKEWRSIIERKAQTAVASITRTLESLITADMIGICQAIICIAMVPAMQVHLLNSTSAKPLVQRMGHHNLEFCLIVAEELRRTYFGAEILYRMFSYARKQILDRRTGGDIRTGKRDSRTSNAEELTADRQDDEGFNLCSLSTDY